jgi:D-3-phosphoglycerate dehydrogenase / 2-oxoglutarate reductase
MVTMDGCLDGSMFGGVHLKILCVGDAMIFGDAFAKAAVHLGDSSIVSGDWEANWDQLQHRRLIVEQKGPGVEPIPAIFENHLDAKIVLGLFCPFSAEAMDAFTDLKIIGVARAGVENVDVEAATERGILVFHITGRNAQAVSDFAIGMMLCEARNIARAHAAIRNGVWQKQFANSSYIPELRNKKIGIVGFGHIGRLVAQKLSGFDVEILVYDPWVQGDLPCGTTLVSKETLFSEADFITIHARLTEQSKHLVGQKELSLMKPTAYLINTARAGLIDTNVLVSTLQERKIAGAALDVFDIEPIPDGHPLLSLDNVTLTTHIAGTTREALTRSSELLVEQIDGFFAGSDRVTLKNPQVLEKVGVRSGIQQLISQLGRKAIIR